MTGPAPGPARVAVYALTREGAGLARRIAAGLARGGEAAEVRVPTRFATQSDAVFESLAPDVAEMFGQRTGLVFVAATGIVVRTLAPLLVHKTRDPGVVVVDQAGRFAVSLLSGHLGGGNALARRVAAVLDAQAVVTTATDVAGVPSVDLMAAERGLSIENPEAIRHVSAALLEGEAVPVFDPEGWMGELPDGLFRVDSPERLGERPAVLVSWRAGPTPPHALVLRPRALFAGVGCRAGTEAGEILALVRETLAANALAPGSLAGLATVEAKADEPGLAEASARLGLPLTTYSSEALAAVAVPSPSLAPLKAVGTPSVCEAAAILSAARNGIPGRLIVTKTKTPRATLAVATVAPATVETSAN